MIMIGNNNTTVFQTIKVLSMVDRDRLVQQYHKTLQKKKSINNINTHIFEYDVSNINQVSFINIDNLLQSVVFLNKSFNKNYLFQICEIENIILRKTCVRRYYIDHISRKILYYDDLQLNQSDIDSIKSNTIQNINQIYITNDTPNIPLLIVISI
jgi:hypothetical protein